MCFINFRTAILCGIYCLCGLTVNAQEITVNLTLSRPGAPATTGNGFFNSSRDRDLFSATANPDGITTSSELIDPITNPVPEAGDAGLELTLVNATATTGVDGFGGDNRADFRVSGTAMSMSSTNQRIDPDVDANTNLNSGVLQSSFRLDATHEEFLTFSFNQNVTVSAIVITSLDPGETFQFGSATNITDLSDLTLDDLTLGTISMEGDVPFVFTTFTFATPLAIPAGEEIVVGQTVFNPDTLAVNNTGVGMSQIILTVDGGGAPLMGDVNMDGIVDCDDLDGYVGNIGAAAVGALAALDVDGSGTLEASDATTHIMTLVTTSNGVVGTFPGDVNCDGVVNVLGDALALVTNLGNTVMSYSQGDVNFDGQVNVLGDALILVTNLGNSNQ